MTDARGESITLNQGRMVVPDHPILPGIAETLYLKGFAYELIR